MLLSYVAEFSVKIYSSYPHTVYTVTVVPFFQTVHKKLQLCDKYCQEGQLQPDFKGLNKNVALKC